MRFCHKWFPLLSGAETGAARYGTALYPAGSEVGVVYVVAKLSAGKCGGDQIVGIRSMKIGERLLWDSKNVLIKHKNNALTFLQFPYTMKKKETCWEDEK